MATLKHVRAVVFGMSAHTVCLGAGSDPSLQQAGYLYLTWCHNQPISLFKEDNLLQSLRSRDHELRLAIQAISLRFPIGSLTSRKREKLNTMAKTSRRLVMERIVDSQVDLSTLQTLCLLSLIDFTGKSYSHTDTTGSSRFIAQPADQATGVTVQMGRRYRLSSMLT